MASAPAVARDGTIATAAAPVCPADYRGDHHRLLRRVGPSGARATAACPGGIAIPIARSLRTELPGLELGYRLATELGIPLVLHLSRDARAVDLDDRFRAPHVKVVEPAGGGPAWRKGFRAHRHPLSTLHRSNDVGVKRSAALLQAAREGWGQVLFLDDDVWPTPGPGALTLDAASLADASAALAAGHGLRAIGWTSDDFPDNSVYGHARRQLGEQQTVFIGSGALLVTVDEDTPFFPDIYNEDWLFLIETARRTSAPGAALGLAGGVNQLRYWPFKIDRARSEEAGDVFAEGLMNLLEDRPDELGSVARGKEFWRDALAARELRLAGAGRALMKSSSGDGGSPRARQDANTALLAAEGVRSIVPAYSLAEYFAEWQDDLALWRETLSAALRSG